MCIVKSREGKWSLKKKQRKDKRMVSCGSKNTESYKMEINTEGRKLDSL